MRKIITPIRICSVCKKSYERKPRVTVSNFLKSSYCSQKCHYQGDYSTTSGKKNHWWNGGTLKCLDCGLQRHNNYSRKRCRKCWWRFTKGKNHPCWRENISDYKYLHQILINENGNPKECAFCHITKGRLEWANKAGNYTRYISDYIGLCVPCHRSFDLKNPKRPKK